MEDESDYTDDYVPGFLNEEPIVLMGLTDSELFLSLGGGVCLGIVGAVLFGLLFGLSGTIIMVVFVVFAGIGFFASAGMIKNGKAEKPAGYLGMKVKKAGARFLPGVFNGSQLYLFDDRLTTGRSKRQILVYEEQDVKGGESE